MKKINMAISIFLALALSILTPAMAPAAAKGKIIIAQGADASSLYPHKRGSAIDVNLYLTMYDLLIRRTGEGKLELNLATSYKIIDPTTWEFKIKKGVTFHNGDPLKARDVKFSYDRMRDPKTKNPFRTFFVGIREVVVIDDFTVKVITEKPDPILPQRMAFAAFIVPEKYIKDHGDEYFAKNPVGSGRYKFVKW